MKKNLLIAGIIAATGTAIGVTAKIISKKRDNLSNDELEEELNEIEEEELEEELNEVEDKEDNE